MASLVVDSARGAGVICFSLAAIVSAADGGDGFGVQLVEVDPGAARRCSRRRSTSSAVQVGQGAGAEPVAAAADVVAEQAAASAAYLGVDQPGAAAGAGQQPAQVVAVGALLGGGLVAFVEDALRPGRTARGDDWLVQARVLDAPVGDDAEVVAVVQQLVQLGQRDRLGWSLRGGTDVRPSSVSLRCSCRIE